MPCACKPYPSDVSDEEWALVAPYLTLLPEEAGQREHSLREVLNGRTIIKTGAPWRGIPNDLPPRDHRLSAGAALPQRRLLRGVRTTFVLCCAARPGAMRSP
jgi:transposase